jgi:hypothetical protein
MSNLKVTTINDKDGGSNAVLYGVAAPTGSMGFRNRILNGDCRIDQRNAGAAVTVNTGGAFYPVDRFRFSGVSSSGVFTAQQVSDAPAEFTKSVKVTVTTIDSSLSGSDLYYAAHFIEGFNTADLAWGSASALAVTLSFWAKSSVTGTFGGALSNNGVNRSYPFTYTINAANTWEQKTVTIAGDTTGTWATDNNTGIRIYWGLGVASGFAGTAGSWAASQLLSATGATNLMATNAATWQITGVQLEAGSVASPFERRDYGRELMMCQRYFRSMQRQAGNDGTGFAMGTCYGNNDIYITYGGVHPVEMRATPTLSTVSTFRVEDGYSTNWTVSSIGIGATTSTTFNPNIQLTTSAPAGRLVYLQATNNASRIQLSAEL